MTTALPGWSYATSVPAPRLAALTAWRDFAEIVARLATVNLVGAEWEPFHGAALLGCHRASVLLDVPEDVYDAFYNSPVGIRAQFARSQTHGETADRNVITALEARLLTAFRDIGSVPAAWLERSLHGREAKTWIVESEVEEQDAELIVYEPWERASLAREGLRAPIGRLLEVKGAWINENGAEVPNPAKAHRSYTIHRTGYI